MVHFTDKYLVDTSTNTYIPRFSLNDERFYYRQLDLISIGEVKYNRLKKREIVEHLLMLFDFDVLAHRLKLLDATLRDAQHLKTYHIALALMSLSHSKLIKFARSLARQSLKPYPLLRSIQRNDTLGIVILNHHAIPFIPRHATKCNITTQICIYKKHCRCLYKSNHDKKCTLKPCSTVYE